MNAKKKGNKGENNFAAWLRNNNVTKASRNTSSGGNAVKSDVTNDLDINFEVKTVKSLNFKKAMEQSEKDAFSSHSIPYVVVHFDGMPEDTWYMVMNNFDWLDLWKKGRLPKTIEQGESRDAKYLVQSAILALKKLLKYLEGKV